MGRIGIPILASNQDHALPKIGNSTDPEELSNLESAFVEQLGKGRSTPEFDMTTMPE